MKLQHQGPTLTSQHQAGSVSEPRPGEGYSWVVSEWRSCVYHSIHTAFIIDSYWMFLIQDETDSETEPAGNNFLFWFNDWESVRAGSHSLFSFSSWNKITAHLWRSWLSSTWWSSIFSFCSESSLTLSSSNTSGDIGLVLKTSQLHRTVPSSLPLVTSCDSEEENYAELKLNEGLQSFTVKLRCDSTLSSPRCLSISSDVDVDSLTSRPSASISCPKSI